MKQYDFGITWDKGKCLFTSTLLSDSEKKGLSFIWVTEKNVRILTKDLENGSLKINVLLDTEATYDIPGEPYARFNYAIKDSGGIVINDPDRTRIAIDKAVMHYELLDSEIDIPYTVVVRNWEPKSFRLTEGEKSRLGTPFIIKPACGWGHQGVKYDAMGSVKEIAKARDYDPHDNFLLQEKITPATLNGKKAWFRVFHIFDKIIPCWWDDETGWYGHMKYDEFKKYRLQKLIRYVVRIASITRMSWFSTEVALDKKQGKARFLAIDYVNDQCDMEAKSEHESGVPDRIVRLTAYSMVHAAKKLIKEQETPKNKHYTVLFQGKSSIKAKGLGWTPELLVQNGPS